LIAVGGVSAEALSAPSNEEMNAQTKQNTPNHGHLRGALDPN
jgi:hypothetical protein